MFGQETQREDTAKPLNAAFLSHSSADGDLAQELCGELEKRGYSCWIAPRDLHLGEPWALGCLRGLVESESVVLLASEKALASIEVLTEVAQAHKRSKPIYTVLIPPAQVKGEMDYYLSRLHWLPRGGRTPEELAAVLARVLSRPTEWTGTAIPPSLQRTRLYRPAAFMRMVATGVVATALVIGTGLWAVNHALDHDFRRLGYVDLAESAASVLEQDGVLETRAQVWLMADGVPFRDVRLFTATDVESHAPLPGPRWPMPERMGAGSMEARILALDPRARRLTTCLTVPAAEHHSSQRVTQQFALTAAPGGIFVAEISKKRVSREDGSPCTVAQ